MELAAKILAFVLIVIPSLAAFVASVLIWRGYVLSIVWAWFAVPLLGLPALSLAQAIGVNIVASMLTSERTWREVHDEKKTWQPAIMAFVSPAITLSVAWIVKQYI